jgi:hypothetical protein
MALAWLSDAEWHSRRLAQLEVAALHHLSKHLLIGDSFFSHRKGKGNSLRIIVHEGNCRMDDAVATNLINADSVPLVCATLTNPAGGNLSS